MSKTAITPTRSEDFPEWFQQVIRAADMAENAPVRGCMTLKPYGYAIWENMQRVFDGMIKAEGVENVYFPLLIPLSYMSREAEHVEGFAKECAVVTHHRLEKGEDGNLIAAPSAKLEEPYIIRPTSETVIGEAMSRWIQSYRDLPLKLNQWCSVMRWEMRPRIFLRTSEFLWQEGHNAFASAEDADADAIKMMHIYADFARDYLALPSIRGKKTPEETFPGAVSTYTFESMMQDGKALQSGTSHYMGQNFAKSIGIKFQNKDGQEEHAYTTSWGISTRLIGAMIMTHADDDGLIMPPRIAPQQVIILPIMKDNDEALIAHCEELNRKLNAVGIRAKVDLRDRRTPDKMWDAIKKGVPLRVEIGAKEMADGMVTHTRRDLGRESKTSVSMGEFIKQAPDLLAAIHQNLHDTAEKFLTDNIKPVDGLDEMVAFFKTGQIGFVKISKALAKTEGYEKLLKDNTLTERCMPLEDPEIIIVGKAY